MVGEGIKPGSFVIEDNSNGTANKIYIKDDKYGNLIASGSNFQISQSSTTSVSSSENYIGNIFYNLGVVTITETGSYKGAWNLVSANPEKTSPSMNSENNLPYGFFIKPDGTKYWMIGAEGSKEGIFEYSLPTAWDVTNATYTGNSIDYSGLSTGTDAFTDVHFKYDGTKMYTLNKDTDDIVEYPLTTAWDITTVTDTTTQSFSVKSTSVNPQGFYFRSDGLKVYINGIQSNKTYEMNMSTAWDITSITGTSQSFATSESLDAHEDLLAGITFHPDGNRMYTTGNRQNMVYEHRLSTAWDITTATYHTSKSILDEETNVQGVQWKPDGSKMYTVGFGGDMIDQYHISSASFWSGSGVAHKSNYTASYKMTRTIRTLTWNCVIEPDEFNFTQNATLIPSGNYDISMHGPDSRRYRWDITGSHHESLFTSFSIARTTGSIPTKFKKREFQPYITKIGLYNDDYELICVATLPTPIKKLHNQRMIFEIQMDF